MQKYSSNVMHSLHKEDKMSALCTVFPKFY